MNSDEQPPVSPWTSMDSESGKPWESWDGSDPAWLPKEIDTTIVHSARRYDYWLGGKDNFPVDRESGDAVEAVFPTVRTAALQNRGFLGRAVRYLAEEAGIDQFLDIGTGIPAAGNTHEVAQAVAPSSRVVYVDNDPIVLAHARALLTSTHADGMTAYIDADLRDPQSILGSPALADTLDLSRPVALMLIAVLHFLPDSDHPYDIVRTLTDALPPGSFLAIAHGTGDYLPPETRDRLNALNPSNGQAWMRGLDDIAHFFDGHSLVSPGIVPVHAWHPDQDDRRPYIAAEEIISYGGVARLG
jgi:hypothetical protein